MTGALSAGLALGQALMMALPGAAPAALGLLVASASPALAELALTDPTAAARELAEGPAGQAIRRGSGPAQAAPTPTPKGPPPDLAGAALMSWAREHGRA